MSNSPLFLSAADIHGNVTQYEKIKSIVTERGVCAVFLCGDLLPKTGGTWTPENKIRTIQMQANFINDYFVNYLRELGELTRVYAIFGNDDFISNYPSVTATAIPNVTFLHNEVVPLPLEGHDLYVAGYPHVGITPFLHKDWEKWDITPGLAPQKLFRTDGYTSRDGVHIAVDLADSSETVAADLANLRTLSDPRKTIYIFHEAPYDTPLDQISADNKYIKDDLMHIGSMAIREFIETEQPLVTMHGHIHETYAESGDYKCRIANSLSLTAANDFASNTLSYVLFSAPDTSYVERLQA